MTSYPLSPLPEVSALRESRPPAAPAQEDESRSTEVELGGRPHVVGVTWPAGAVDEGAEVELREQVDGRWGDWQDLEADLDEGPDPGTAEEEGARAGTAPWVSMAESVQVRIVGVEGAGEGARLDVVDTTVTDGDRSVTSDVRGGASAAATRPTIYSRASWGADERIRKGSPSTGTVKAAIVHHTAGANGYSSSQVPGIIRGIYSYHVNGNGWNDIGYNFLVDRFGRTWEGRYGGTTKDIIGAHAAPYNSSTFGISVIGDFSSVEPPSAVPTALSKVIAWRLGLKRVNPAGSTSLEGMGTSPTVIGHRDVNQTSCPGARLYAKLGAIRTRAKSYQGVMLYGSSIDRSSFSYGGSGIRAKSVASRGLTWRLTITSPCRSEMVRRVTGTVSGAGSFTASWNGRMTDGRQAPPGEYRLALGASSGSGTVNTAVSKTWTVRVTGTTAAPPGYCPPRLSGPSRYDVAVATAFEKTPNSPRVVLVSGEEKGMTDALVAAPLAQRRSAALLLTAANALPDVTAGEISRRKATEVTIVGGPATVSAAVVSQLRYLGVRTIDRVSGEDRYEVAARVASRVTQGGAAPDVFVASGSRAAAADGLVLSGPATALTRPILLVGSGVPEPTRKALSELGTTRTVVAGGPRTVSAATLSALPRATRLGGEDRYAVSGAVATWARKNGVAENRVLVSSGQTESLADTLSGGQLRRVILYVRSTSAPSVTRQWLADADGLDSITVLGGPDSVSLLVGGTVQRALTG
ncbi:cell wall-binding repeat-containing protein [Phycicoccus sp. CSK15P-2]|uniref:cell wall-binding repeat-containing protein n=1 Tax=Phycicoccus sp. CSK15P-2 TaxID=2807627 RepID=UPI00195034AC|nr:cell wall-binding repeat-containing protein [Phycicoccus sp. CSK15P-2]MBM6402954.1 cell wall-binding repeat-containing protein [Phycicoccus sp. CSK15P-2]